MLTIFNLAQICMLPVTWTELQKVTCTDPIVSKMLHYTRNNRTCETSEELKVYHTRMSELSIKSVLCGKCIMVVPQKLRSSILKEIHTSHMRLIKMKVDARSFVWWPSINKEIENVARSCDTYLSVEYAPSSSPLHPWSRPNQPCSMSHYVFGCSWQSL